MVGDTSANRKKPGRVLHVETGCDYLEKAQDLDSMQESVLFLRLYHLLSGFVEGQTYKVVDM